MVGPFMLLAPSDVIIFSNGLAIYVPPVQTQVSVDENYPKSVSVMIFTDFMILKNGGAA